MQAMAKQPINVENVDCSEIACNLQRAAGGEGKIMSFKGEVDGLLNTPEGDGTVEYEFHHVYTDGKYIYDPRLSETPIPQGDYMRTMKSLNPGLRYGPPGFDGYFS